ncbi:MAG TPA: ABC transporter permease [Solirubrobacterales bacterium]|nr:ABC transporter permease [Solirubrobacterales bacterium]
MSAATADAGTIARPRRRSILSRVKGWPTSVKVGAGIVGVLALAALFAPLIAPYGPNEIDPFSLLQSPSSQHLFGTDDTGRDVFSRTLYGLRLDIGLCLLVTFVPLPFAIIVGALAGYFGGWLDMIVSRLADVFIAFPFIVLVIAVVAIVGPGVKGFLIGVPLAAWALYARLARAEMLIVREQPYMLATTALGYSKWRAILKHGLPNVARPCFVYTTIDLIGNLILLAGLSYLGFGVQPPTAELGGIIADGQGYLLTAWWISTLPGLVLVLFGVGVGLIGEGLSDRGLERGGR